VLSVAALIFCGALGWDWMLRERRAGRPERADFPLALALVLLAVAGVLTGLLYRAPRLAEWFVRTHGSPDLTPERVRQGIGYLQAEGWAAIATAAAVAALLGLCRWRRPPARLLAGIALILLAFDLWHYGHGLVKVAPAALYQGPPPVRVPPETRLFVEERKGAEPDFVPRRGDPSLAPLAPVQALLDRMEPYSAVLWRIPYALNEDFDLMLTPWGSRALEILHQDWDRSSEDALRYLGTWNVGRVLLRKEAPAWAAERDPGAPLMKELDNRFLLPRHRFVPRVVFHPDPETALAAARREGYALMRREHAVRPGTQVEVAYPRMPEPLELEERGGRLRLRYRSGSPAFFVLAETFDEGWQAEAEGSSLAVFPTAAGQIGVELPAGEHVLELRYRERLLPLGTAVTLATLAAVLGALLLGRRSR
jgi:hypothetical protein